MKDSVGGLVNAFKLPGPSSRETAEAVRRAAREKKAGHAGTLDPAAGGVLLVLMGRCTRLQDFLMALDKVYVAELAFGVETDSGDAFGRVVEATDRLPSGVRSLTRVLPRFEGEIEQVPPMTSAIKHRGQPLHRLARRGEEVSRRSRTVSVYRLELLDWRPDPLPRALLRIRCSSGTYIRTLVTDIARSLGSRGHMSFLVRSSVGPFCASDAQLINDENPPRLLPPSEALAFLPAVRLQPADVRNVVHGGLPDTIEIPSGGRVRLLDPSGQLVAVAEGSLTARPRLLRVLMRPGDPGSDAP